MIRVQDHTSCAYRPTLSRASPVKLVRGSCWWRWKPCASKELRSNCLKVKVVYLKLHRITGLFRVPPNRLSRVKGSDGWAIQERSSEGGNNRDLYSIQGDAYLSELSLASIVRPPVKGDAGIPPSGIPAQQFDEFLHFARAITNPTHTLGQSRRQTGKFRLTTEGRVVSERHPVPTEAKRWRMLASRRKR